MPNLTDDQRRRIIDDLLRCRVDGFLPRGAFAEMAKKVGRTDSAIHKIWSRYCATEASTGCGEWKSRIAAKSGRKRADRDEARERIRAVPIEERRPIWWLVEASGISAHLILSMLKEGILKRKSGRIKPALTQENKLQRLEYVLAFIDQDSLQFESMFDVVHIDEKWFYDDVDKRSYIAFEGETVPYRARRSKHFMPKTMFLTAVARPRYGRNGQVIFDGKIGLWPFTEEYIAQRRSLYRARGEVCIRNIESITRDVYKGFLLDFVFPAIKEKWPWRERGKNILVQQDNAKPHVSPFDPDILAAGTEGGWKIHLIYQPANSPDMNCLDLGLYASLQATQHQQIVHGIEERIDSVEAAYDELDDIKLDNVFLTLQKCMESVLRVGGSNQYPLPHMGKAKLRREGKLPESDRAAYENAINILKEANRPSLLFFQQTTSG